MTSSPLPGTTQIPSSPASPLFAVRQTPHAGRAIYATQRIPAHTHLHTCPSPTTFVINREYRREVCRECFRYDRGVNWKLRDAATGVVWCSVECESSWKARFNANGDGAEAAEALAAVEKFVSKAKAWNNGEWDTAMLDAAGAKPLEDEIEAAWKSAEDEAGKLIRNYRSKCSGLAAERVAATKAEKKAFNNALAVPPAPDILSYLLSAVLVAHCCAEQWSEFLDLHATPTPYTSPSSLSQHISAFHQLLAILPASLLHCVTPEVLLAASTRDAHNSFGLRSLDDGGSEMFGFGVWPSASYWNHSCAPNVAKRRVGRGWQFETSSDVEVGQELCITYLGGEEKELNLKERKKRLRETWGFDCTCSRCSDEVARDESRL